MVGDKACGDSVPVCARTQQGWYYVTIVFSNYGQLCRSLCEVARCQTIDKAAIEDWGQGERAGVIDCHWVIS